MWWWPFSNEARHLKAVEKDVDAMILRVKANYWRTDGPNLKRDFFRMYRKTYREYKGYKYHDRQIVFTNIVSAFNSAEMESAKRNKEKFLRYLAYGLGALLASCERLKNGVVFKNKQGQDLSPRDFIKIGISIKGSLTSCGIGVKSSFFERRLEKIYQRANPIDNKYRDDCLKSLLIGLNS